MKGTRMKTEQRILKVLHDYPRDGCWGYDLLRLARVRSGRMYPTLARLETAGVVVSWWVGETEPRRRRYRLAGEPSPVPDGANERLAAALRTQIKRTETALDVIDAVLELHQPYRSPLTDEFDICPECTQGIEFVPYPCPTRRALPPDGNS
jgi:hypothetical protein